MSKRLQFALTFNIAWTSLIFFSKKALNAGIEPIPFLVESSLVNLIVLSSYIYLFKRRAIEEIKNKDFKSFIGIGVFVAVAWLTEVFGLRLSTAINYSFIIETSFVFAIVLAFFFLGEVIHRRKVLIMTTIMTGAYLMSTGGALIIPKSGDILIVIAAFCYSASNILQKPVLKRVEADVVGWARVLFSLFIILILTTIFNVNTFSLVAPLFIFLAGCSSAATTVYISKTISVSSVSYLTVMSMLTPVVNVFLGTTFLGETINIYQVVGGIFIIGSIILAQDKKFGM